jgi:DnaD/phage-associated family protein
MKLCFTYGNDALMLPVQVVQHVDKANKKDIKVLLTLAAEPMARVDLATGCRIVAERLALSEREVDAAIAFWRGAGVISALDEGDVAAAAAPVTPEPQQQTTEPRVIADGGLPAYSSTELSGLLERRRELASLVDECQRVFGKIFNTREVSQIAGMVDYLGFEGDYILSLLSHCVRMEKKSLRYAEKMALSLHDEGITECAVLEERLQRIELMASSMGKIRAMFGLASRALTAKEKSMVERWVCQMQYGDDVLRLAYETTVNAINKPSIPYANTILERWYAEGYRTMADVEKALAEYRRKKTEGSFDVDDFFEAALKRTYGE